MNGERIAILSLYGLLATSIGFTVYELTQPRTIAETHTISKNFSVTLMVNPNQKCYGEWCSNPYLTNEIIGSDDSHKYEMLKLRNGTILNSTCLKTAYPRWQNETAWSCKDGIVHTIDFGWTK
jgi:hypothetical protein